MKVAILGATGRCGLLLVKGAMERGYSVRALARNPSKIEAGLLELGGEGAESTSDTMKLLEVVQGSATSIEDVRNLVKGTDVVISALGVNPEFFHKQTFYQETAKVIVEAAKGEKVGRLLIISSGGVEYDPDTAWFFNYLIRPMVMNHYRDMQVMEKVIEDSALEYTLVRPPYLDPSAPSVAPDYRLQDRTCAKGGWKISRQDVVSFMLDDLTSKKWINKHPTITM